MKINARKMALRILNQIDTDKDFSHIALNQYFDQYEIDSVDRRFISYMVLGILENKMLLDFYIRKLSKTRFGKINHEIVNILRMGLYQIEFMSKVPDSAAVNESVKLAKKINPSFGNYVNGILRTFTRDRLTIELPNRKKHPVTHLSIKYSHPEWLVEKWMEEYGPEFTETLMKKNNENADLVIRTNTLKTTTQALKIKLDEAGVLYDESKYIKDALVLKSLNELSVDHIPGYQEGAFQVQDESSMFVGVLSDVLEDDLVIDVCAAPGGKVTHVAQLMNNKGKILARDLYEHKLANIKENADRLGIDIISTQTYDAQHFDKTIAHQGDVVLVDAPCSGLGIIRRKPDIKYNKTPESLLELEQLQRKILETASEYVKEGGQLIYSTCTLNRAENEEVVNWFLTHHSNFKLDLNLSANGMKISDQSMRLLTEEGIALVESNTVLSLFPNVHGTDGFFIAKMTKII